MTQIQQLKQQHSLASWKQTILAQQNSGLTAAEYCRQQNIKYNAFYYWQRKIREDFAASALQIPQKDSSNRNTPIYAETFLWSRELGSQ